MKKPPVVIGGRPIGRLRASWLLFRESWRFMSLDKELLWVPVLSGFVNIFFFGLLVVALVMTGTIVGTESLETETEVNGLGYVFLFGFYFLSAFCVAFAEAVITFIVYKRLHGENATLGDGVRAATQRIKPILLWSAITSTVGMLLRFIAERSRFLGMIVASVIGAAWSIMTYFVVPGIMIQKLSAPKAIKSSGSIFMATWGETLVSNITLGFVFLIAHLLMFVALFGVVMAGLSTGIIAVSFAALILFFLWLMVAILVNAVLGSILRTLLYVYATEGPEAITNFNHELLENMLVKQQRTVPIEREPFNESTAVNQ